MKFALLISNRHDFSVKEKKLIEIGDEQTHEIFHGDFKVTVSTMKKDILISTVERLNEMIDRLQGGQRFVCHEDVLLLKTLKGLI